MSNVVIRQLLETRLGTLLPALPSAFENVAFNPVKGVPHQRVFVMLAQTEGPTLGDGFKRERGILQATLYYPEGRGFGEVGARAEDIKALFKRGTTLQQGLVRVLVYAHPYSTPQGNHDGFFVVPVSIPFQADVHAG